MSEEKNNKKRPQKEMLNEEKILWYQNKIKKIKIEKIELEKKLSHARLKLETFENGKSKKTPRPYEVFNQQFNVGKKMKEINRVLYRISNAINTTYDLDELYAFIHSSLNTIINIENFFIAIYNKKDKTLAFPYHVDTTDDAFGPVFVDPIRPNSLSGQVLIDGKPTLLKVEELKKRKAEDRIYGPMPVIWLGVPLIVKNNPIGVMAVQSYNNPNLFDNEDMDVFNSVSEQIAIAIERKFAEEALTQSEYRFKEMANLLPTIVCELDKQLHVTYINHMGSELLGLPRTELKKDIHLLDYVDPKDQKRMNLLFSKIQTDKNAENAEFRFIKKNSKTMEGLVNCTLILNQNIFVGFRMSISDITPRKRLEAELRRARMMEAIGTLAGGIAHDFNNILNIILGNISLAKMDNMLKNGTLQYLIKAEEALLMAQDLTGKFMTFSKGGTPSKKLMSIGPFILKNTNRILKKTMVELICEFPDDLWPVKIDTNQMYQVVRSIITNAKEAMPNGGTLEIRAENFFNEKISDKKKFSLRKKYIKISFKDNGIGIPKSHLSRVFDPYFSTKERGIQKGMGLGLALVESTIRKHDGWTTLESESGVGTRIEIYLPA